MIKKGYLWNTGGTNLKRFIGFILAVILLLPFLPVPPVSAEARQVVIFTMDRITLEEWTNSPHMPNLRRLMDESSLGFLSLRTVGTITSDKIYAMIGSGGLVPAGAAATWAYDANEMIDQVSAAQVYQSLYGRSALNGPVHLGIAKLNEQRNEEYSYRYGELGRILHKMGFLVAVAGNYDTLNRQNRAGVTMVMDEYGRVDEGAVGSGILTADTAFPMGIRTDYQRLFEEYRLHAGRMALTLMISGDLERLESYRSQLSDTALARARTETLRRCDELIGRLLAVIHRDNTLLIVLVTTPPNAMVQNGERMSPLLLYGPGFGRGLVRSYSTRQRGLVTPADVTSTILHFLGSETPPEIDGRPIRSVAGNVNELLSSHRFWANNYQQRWPILTAYAYIMIVLILAGLVGIFYYRRHWYQDIVRNLLRILMGVPLAFLWVSVIDPELPLFTAALTILFSVALAFLIGLFVSDERRRLMMVCLLTALTIMVDLMTGTHLLRSSILSYSVMVGARFYGLGNEYMGVLLGSFLLGISGFYDMVPPKYHRRLLLILVASMLWVIGLIMHPSMGANVGGGLSAVIGFSIAFFIFTGRRIHWRNALLVPIAVIFVLIFMAYLDYRSGFSNTHLGQNIRLIKTHGFSAIIQIINRKWRMNMGLLLVTPWARVLVVFLLTLPLLFRRPPGVLQQIFLRYPSFARGLTASIVAAFAALILNDSGIVAAATAMIYGGISLICLVLKEIKTAVNNESWFGGMGHGDKGLPHLGD